MGFDAHQPAVGEAVLLDVIRVQEDHFPTTLDASVSIRQAVDGGVGLVVTAQRLQHEVTGGYLQRLDRGDNELGPA